MRSSRTTHLRRKAVSSLVLQAYLRLIYFDLYLARGDFSTVCEKVRQSAVSRKVRSDVERVCRAVDVACIWYWKHVLCLQRSAATACLLKRNGIPAELVIGTQTVPFKAHAWVEVECRIVNDKSYMHEIYAELDRC